MKRRWGGSAKVVMTGGRCRGAHRMRLAYGVRIIGSLLLFGAVLAGPGAAQQSRLLSDVDTTVITVGDRVVLAVSVDHPAGSTVRWPDSLNLGAFEVLDAQRTAPEATESGLRSMALLVLTAFELGELEIPSFDVTVEGPGEALETLSTDRFGIEVASVGIDESGEIRDIRGPLGIPVGVVTVSLWALVFILLGAIAFWLVQRFLRGGAPEVPEAVREPPRPVDLVALEALARVEDSPMLQRGLVKEFHIEISEILRTYVEGRFGVSALEMTTREVLYGLRTSDADDEWRDGLGEFLDGCDLVKFAKFRPTSLESQSTLELGRALVRRAGAAPEPEVDLPMHGAGDAEADRPTGGVSTESEAGAEDGPDTADGHGAEHAAGGRGADDVAVPRSDPEEQSTVEDEAAVEPAPVAADDAETATDADPRVSARPPEAD